MDVLLTPSTVLLLTNTLLILYLISLRGGNRNHPIIITHTQAPLVRTSIAPRARVLVTGATGYAAGWIIKLLLDRGYSVRATVRNIKTSKLDYLRRLATPERLEFVECDLTSSQAVWTAAVRGCEGVCHVASPMDFGSTDPLHELVAPQLHGTRCLLNACATEGVKRFVLTSSAQTVSCMTPDWETRVYTESDWDSAFESSLDRFPYAFSKMLQEKLCVDFAVTTPGLSVVSIVPYAICGPALPGSPCNSSLDRLFGSVLNGLVFCGIHFSVGLVDVRDVALAHVRALEVPEAQGRYLAWGSCLSYADMYSGLKAIRPDLNHNIPSAWFVLPRALDWVLLTYVRALFGKGVSDIVSAGLGKFPRFDASRTTKELGVDFHPPRDTLVAVTEALVEWGRIQPKA
jgi:dihydroflavonol-4-reductase